MPGASGLTNCRFGIHVDVSEGRIAVGSNGGHRISAPILFDEAMDRAYATLEHPDPTSPLSTAFQFVYSVREVVPRVGASIARVVD